jgi:hypothetical protein
MLQDEVSELVRDAEPTRAGMRDPVGNMITTSRPFLTSCALRATMSCPLLK